MKQYFEILKISRLALAFVYTLCGFAPKALGVPYASSPTNSGGNVTFLLNESSDSVKVIFNNGVGGTNDLGARTKGLNSFNLGSATNYQIIVSKSGAPGYAFASGTNANLLQFSSDTNSFLNFNSPRGIAVNRDPRSAYFGRIYVANSAAGTSTQNGVNRTLGDGIYLLNADQSDALGLVNTASTGGLTFNSSANSPYRLTIGSDNRVYIADFADASGNLYVTDGNVSAGSGAYVLKQLTTNAFGTNITAAPPVGTNNAHGAISAVRAEGSLAAGNLKVYTIDSYLQDDRTTTALTQQNSLWVYNIGAGPLPYTNLPTRLWTASGTEGINTIFQTMDMARGADGKFYITDFRLSGQTQCGLIVRSADGLTTLFNSYDASVLLTGQNVDLLATAFAVGVSPDQKFVAVARSDSRVWILPLTNSIPDLSRRMWLESGSLANARGIEFDAAGNLYVLSSGHQVLRIFSPGGNTVAITGNDITGTNGTFAIYEPPAIVNQPTNLSLDIGDTAVFTAMASGTQPTYQWLFNGTNILQATNSSYVISSVQLTNGGNYSVLVSNPGGSVVSTQATLTVIYEPVAITVQPASQGSLVGDTVTLTVIATGSKPSYQWQFYGTNIFQATNATLVINSVQLTNTGHYSVQVTNSGSSTNSATATVTVFRAGGLKRLWSLNPGDRPYITANFSTPYGSSERGLAYNPVTGHLLILSRALDPLNGNIFILNADTGAEIGSLNMAGISGGFYGVNKLAIADDGSIYAGNLAVTGSGAPEFKLYRWSSENTNNPPTVAYDGDPGSGFYMRWGDRVDSRGAGTNTQIILNGKFGTSNMVAILSTTDGTNFGSKAIGCDTNFPGGVTFADGNAFWGNADEPKLRLTSFDLAAGASTNLASYQLPGLIAAIKAQPKLHLLAGLVSGPPRLVALYNTFGAFSPPDLITSQAFDSNNGTSSTGEIVFGKNRLYALDALDGLIAMDILPVMNLALTSPSGAGILGGGSTVTIQWQSSADPGIIVSQEVWLSLDGGATYTNLIATNLSSSAQSFVWNIPSNLGGPNAALRIIVRDALGNAYWNDSDFNFFIVPAGLIQNIAYSYDELGQLIKAQYSDSSSISYAYDAAGNRTNMTILAGTSGDSDGDGLPDSWETQYFGNLDFGPNDDPDHDGMSNLAEFLAGTNPNAPGSVFAITSLTRSASNVVLQWLSSSNKTYSVLRSPDLLTNFTVLRSNLPATPPVNSLTDTNTGSATQQFYRVKGE